MMKKILSAAVLAMLLSCQGGKMELTPEAVKVDITGNTYVTAGKEGARVSQRGIGSWTGADAVLSTWFKLGNTGELRLFMELPDEVSPAVFQVRVLGKEFTVNVKDTEVKTLPIGKVKVTEPGYLRVDIQGVSKEGEQYPFIKALVIDGPAAAEPLHFVRDFEPYWGLRGPSVHMSYTMPETDVEYFYNEITVPEGEDQIGSYFMTNGFGEGYCGIQVNRETERRILFSVWSPFETDNPKDIPEDQRIKLLAQGEGVHIGEFGNEGSGGQSYLIYPWKAGVTYPVITRVHPDGKGNTHYYAWFYAAEESRWRLIAGFSRPQTDTWYKRAHSFLENFNPQQGYLGRKVFFNNQWVLTAKGEWMEMTEGTFTHDATARAGVRMDYAGGVEESGFFLRNGGFFNDYTEFKSVFNRTAKGTHPEVDVKTLPLK